MSDEGEVNFNDPEVKAEILRQRKEFLRLRAQATRDTSGGDPSNVKRYNVPLYRTAPRKETPVYIPCGPKTMDSEDVQFLKEKARRERVVVYY